MCGFVAFIGYILILQIGYMLEKVLLWNASMNLVIADIP